MIENRAKALDYIIESEGRTVNEGPSEPGGASKFGVSVTALSDLRHKRGESPATVEDVRNLTEQDARDFYTQMFMPLIRFDALPAGVDYRVLDIAVNLGVSGGIRTFRAAMHLDAIGPMTDIDVTTAFAIDRATLIRAIGDQWLAVKRKSPHWPLDAKPSYQHGWLNRNARVTTQALQMAGVQ